MGNLLIAYWIDSGVVPHGYGVTAFSEDDAMALVRNQGLLLPDDLSLLRIVANIRLEDLDQAHVVPNMGPMVVRGVWYPLVGGWI